MRTRRISVAENPPFPLYRNSGARVRSMQGAPRDVGVGKLTQNFASFSLSKESGHDASSVRISVNDARALWARKARLYVSLGSGGPKRPRRLNLTTPGVS